VQPTDIAAGRRSHRYVEAENMYVVFVFTKAKEK